MRYFIFELLRQIRENSMDIELLGECFFFQNGIEYVLFNIRFKGTVTDLFLANIFTCVEEKRAGVFTTARFAVSRAKLIEWYRHGSEFSEYEKSLK